MQTEVNTCCVMALRPGLMCVDLQEPTDLVKSVCGEFDQTRTLLGEKTLGKCVSAATA